MAEAPLVIQHELIPFETRQALGEALLNATVEGHAGFTALMLRIMAMTVAGSITVAQAEVVTAQAELLFTNIVAQRLTEARSAASTLTGTLGGTQAMEDELTRTLREAREGASKVRPSLEMAADPTDDKYGLEIYDDQGNLVPLMQRP